MILKNTRAGFYKNYRTTLYLGTEAQIHQGAHGVRLYPRPIDKFSYVRLELQLNYRGIKKHGLQLTISPDAVSVFDYLEFRRTNIPKLVELLTKKAKKRYQHKRYRGKIDLYGLCQDTACSYVEHVLDNKFNPEKCDYYPLDYFYGFRTPVAHELSNFKREFPEYRHRVEDIFPKWCGRKEEIMSMVKRG